MHPSFLCRRRPLMGALRERYGGACSLAFSRPIVGHTMKDSRCARRRGGYDTAHGTNGSIVSTPGLNMPTCVCTCVCTRTCTRARAHAHVHVPPAHVLSAGCAYYYFLLPAYRQLLLGPRSYLLLATCYLLLATCYLLLATCYLLLTASCSSVLSRSATAASPKRNSAGHLGSVCMWDPCMWLPGTHTIRGWAGGRAVGRAVGRVVGSKK